jgi:hypothetical protein
MSNSPKKEATENVTQSPSYKRTTRRSASGENFSSLTQVLAGMGSPGKDTKIEKEDDSEESTDVDVSGLSGWKGYALRVPKTEKE